MSKKVVFITGASGSMGSEVLKQILDTNKFKGLVLLRRKPQNEKLAKVLEKKYGENIDVMFGDLYSVDDCKACVAKADYIIHCAAIIPPASDHNPKAAYNTNFVGTKNLVDAINASPRKNEIKFVNIGTVAEYGNRDYKHPWGRIGDPLVVSVYDFYAVTKLKGERYVLDAKLPNFVSLRQTGILYYNLMKNNLDDGLMFHTSWNVPIEWVTAHDSGLALKNLVLKDSEGTLKPGFWNKAYNIGGGPSCRVTGFDTVDAGFKLMGGSAKDFFQPNWNADRNFHCMWFYDSDVLNDYLEYQTESFKFFWGVMAKKYWYYQLGRLAPKSLIRKTTIEKVLKNNNAPQFWVDNNIEGRINAFFGSREKYEKIPATWDKYHLLCEGELPDGSKIDYDDIKDISKVKDKGLLLNHGYDESKKDSELGLEDMKSVAEFRGGKLISKEMKKGDLYTHLEWECHNGHKFSSAPYTIAKAGHWCPTCCQPSPWNFDELSKHIPFFAQIWYDTHDKSEHNFYPEDCYKDIEKFENKK